MPNVDIAAIRDVKSLKGSLPPEEWDARVDLAACYRLGPGFFSHQSPCIVMG